MKNYIYQNTLVSKKQLRELLSWSFTKYGSVESCFLADELKYLGFKYATQAGISISLEDLRVPFIKNAMLDKSNNAILNAEKLFGLGKITNVERFQKIIDTWNITSEFLKEEVVSYFKKYDPLNSIYMMAFSGARGNLSQVRQLVGMRGLMSDPSGEIMNLPIKKNFREGLTITDYLMSGYGARKGIVDTALKTANSGYLTRRLIDVAQDILIREKDCLTSYSFLVNEFFTDLELSDVDSNQVLGSLLNRPIYDLKTKTLIAEVDTQLTPSLIKILKQKNINNVYIRSPLTCRLYRSICQKCYGWNLARENLIDIGDAVGIIAGQSIGEPGTQLTMRTFHTGGIFTSATRQQLISPISGHIQFSPFLRASKIRTNRGENVLLTENSGYLIIIYNENSNKNIQLELPKSTILFIKNNQYVKKETCIGQLATTIKQIRTEIKPVLSNCSGEVFIPKSPRKLNFTTINKLLWVLSGQVFRAPFNSFLNFYSDYKINKNSYIFRSKIINYLPGFIKLIVKNDNLFQSNLEIRSNFYFQMECDIYKLSFIVNYKNSLLVANKFKYLVNLQNSKSSILYKNNITLDLLTNNFIGFTGGTPYYTKEVIRNKQVFSKFNIYFYKSLIKINYRTIVWLSEEIYKLNCDSKFLEVEDNNFVPVNFKLIPKIYSHSSGVIKVKEKHNTVNQINIKSGLVYEVYNSNKLKDINQKVFYPGEIILENIEIRQPCLVEIINANFPYQVLIRSLQIYETPLPTSNDYILNENFQYDSAFTLINYIKYGYISNQQIKAEKNIKLINKSRLLYLNNHYSKNKLAEIRKKRYLKFYLIEKLYLTDYLPAYLKYKNINLCLTIENNQFIHPYSNLVYLESITQKSLELVKIKSKIRENKQIFLISNDDCLLLSKSKIKNKTINNFLINPKDIKEIGKILIENENIFTLQKGRPYFFPNCRNDYFIDDTNLEYHTNTLKELSFYKKSNFENQNEINIQCYDITKSLIPQLLLRKNIEYNCSKIIIKKRRNFYTTGIPIFLRELLNQRTKNLQTLISTFLNFPSQNRSDIIKNLILLRVHGSELISNKTKSNITTEFISLERDRYWFGDLKTPFPFSYFKLHSVTEDYLKQEVNSVCVKNGEFIDDNCTIGLLNFEKEVTGDIVQGLPRIEELLEARKKKKLSKRTSKNQKRSLLIRKTSLDPSFEFRKLGTTIKNNEKINPHNLLKVYFNYYTKVKPILVKNQVSLLFYLTNSYEASYRSFKKVQSLILNSVQSVYKSQGVYIADKHLEIIIKQMTSKVQIRRAGDTPLLPHEVIDLYHIKYVNEVIEYKRQQPAYYIPLLLGVTKASLNNPSFISAASFQETTRVLTKAAIEGKHDWLRGLKENIVIGQLIPVGTGLHTYSNFFDNYNSFQVSSKQLQIFTKNKRSV